MSGIVSCVVHVLIYLLLTVRGRYYDYSHFTSGETEAVHGKYLLEVALLVEVGIKPR